MGGKMIANVFTSNFHPRLALNLTSQSLDSRVSFVRSGDATYFDSDGVLKIASSNVFRLDYDPVTRQPLGRLVEETRTNLATRSEEFNDAAWPSKLRVTVSPNQEIAPNGAMTADKLIEDATASATHYIFRSYVVPIGTYAWSVFVKAGERTQCALRLDQGTPQIFSIFDLSLGTVILQGSGHTASITPVGNGIYRCTVVRSVAIAALATGVGIAVGGNNTYTGDGTSGIYIWGGQVEAGGEVTSYIPTAATAVARNADVATVTGTNFSNIWRDGRGGALVQARSLAISGTRPVVQFDDATADNIIALRGVSANPELYIRAGGSDEAQIDAGTILADTPYNLAGSWAVNDCAASFNSGVAVPDTAAIVPPVTQARLGSDGTNYLNGHIKAIEYYDERILNASLQVLSSQSGYRSIIGPVFRDAIIS
jgi:hypothetical protein